MINGANYGNPYPAKAKPIKKQASPNLSNEADNKPHYVRNTNMLNNNHEQNIDFNTLSFIQNMQQQMVQAHTAYQQAMADSHIAFLNTVENVLNQFTGQTSTLNSVQATRSKPNVAPMPIQSQVQAIKAASQQQPLVVNASPVHQVMTPPVPMERVEPTPAPVNLVPQVASPAPNPTVQKEVVTPDLQPPSTVTSNQLSTSIEDIILEVTAEKTGYPIEMLNLDMGIEADLGIDSIKRVEILSSVQDKMSDLPDMDLAELGSLNTLQEVVDFIKKQQG